MQHILFTPTSPARPKFRPAIAERSRFTRALSAAFLALLLLVTGCSGDGENHSGGPAGSPSPPGHKTPVASSANPSQQGQASGTGWGPSEADWQQAEKTVAGLKPEQLAGQVLVAALPGTTRFDHALIQRLHLGGVILLENNITTVAQTRQLSKDFDRQSRKASGANIPGLISIDQEGGLVQRYTKNQTPFPTAMAYGAIYETNPERARELTTEAYLRIGRQIRELGVTMNFAPDADVTAGASDPGIGARSFSSRPKAAAELSVSAVTGLRQAGIVPVVKHFPGHGAATSDSHFGLPVYPKPFSEITRNQWPPFRAAIDAEVPAVMVGHLARKEQPQLPASVDPSMYQALEKKLNFKGLRVTDALNMGALNERYGPNQAPVVALKSGADLLVMPADAAGAHKAIVEAYRSGEIPKKRLKDAATKVVASKLYQARLAAEREDKTLQGSDEAFIETLFREAVTDLSARCKTPPAVGAGSVLLGADTTQQGFLRAHLKGSGQQRVALIGLDQLSVDAPVAVALNSPWALQRSQAEHQYALYGRGKAAMKVLAEVLSGKHQPAGRLPATVGQRPAGYHCTR